jgi:hypothetical protein
VPQEARFRRSVQEPRGGFAGAFAQRCLTKRSRERRLCEVRRILLARTKVNKGKKSRRRLSKPGSMPMVTVASSFPKGVRHPSSWIGRGAVPPGKRSAHMAAVSGAVGW